MLYTIQKQEMKTSFIEAKSTRNEKHILFARNYFSTLRIFEKLTMEL